MESLFIFITSYIYLCACLSNVHVFRFKSIKCKVCLTLIQLDHCLCKGLQCDGSHEEMKCVQHCPPEKTCTNKDFLFNCFESEEKCQPKCVCENGYYRDITGECVTNETCESKCPGPHEYYDCGVACDNVCETLHIMNQTNCPILNFKCNEMCYCKEGYARDANNICVPFAKCEPSPAEQDRKRRDTLLKPEVPSCGPDEEYKPCTCPPDTCVSLVAKFKCGECVPGCACHAGYLRLRKDEPCRPMRECPQLAHSRDSN